MNEVLTLEVFLILKDCLQSLLSFAQTCLYILIWTVETLSLGNVVQIGKVAIHFLAKLLWYIGMLNPGQKGSQLGNIGGSCENYCFSCDFSSVSRAVQSHYPAQQIPLSHGLIVAFSTKINSGEINGFLVLTLFNTKSTTFFFHQPVSCFNSLLLQRGQGLITLSSTQTFSSDKLSSTPLLSIP